MEDDSWWTAGTVVCVVCITFGAFGNGLTIATIVSFSKFKNPFGYLILR